MRFIPTGWKDVTLGDICEFKYGKGLPEAKRSGGPIPVYGSNGQVGSHDTAVTSGPTIVIGRKGSFGEVTWSDGSCWPIDTTYFVDETATDVDLRWLAHRLRTLGLTELNRAAAVPGLNREDAYRKRLLLPPPEQQQRIAEVLDRAEELGAQRRAAIEQLKVLKQSTFLDMFGDPVSNSRGWPVKKISELGDVVTGNTPPRSRPEYYGSDIEWIKTDNINAGEYYVTPAEEGLSALGRKVARIAPAGSILVTCIAGSRRVIGNAAMTDREVAFNQQINALIPQVGEGEFLYAQLILAKRLVQAASTASMKGMVSKSRFGAISLIFPPVELQRIFEDRMDGLRATERFVSLSERSLSQLSGSLRHGYFAGVA